MNNKITKREKRQFFGILMGILAYALLSKPIENIITSLKINNFWTIVIGIMFIGMMYKMFEVG